MAASSKRAFSLIEMLVVIAIIGVLVAVLLPILSQAKAKAHRVKSVGQLGKIGQAFIGCVQDHEDRLPWQLTPAQAREAFGEYTDDLALDHAAMFSLPSIRQDLARPATVLATTRNLSTCNFGTARWSGADEPDPGPETMAGLQRGQGQIVLADESARLSSDANLGETGALIRDHAQSAGGTYKGPAPTVVLGCGGEPDPIGSSTLEPGELFQVIQSGKGNRYVFVIDCSGSMNCDGRLSMAKSELIAAILSMEPDKEFFIYYYNHDSIPMLGGIKKATKESLRIVTPWIKGQIATGNTNPRAALRDAFEKMEPDTVWLLTDGIFMQQPGMTPVAALIRELNDDEVCVNTIGFHNNRNSVDRSLGPIAVANDGTYRFVNSARK